MRGLLVNVHRRICCAICFIEGRSVRTYGARAKRDAQREGVSSELNTDGTGTGSSGKISYSEPGTYEYLIHETSDLGVGWKNDGDGKVTFGPISYEASDLDGRGTSRDFEYTINEIVPADAVDGVKDGITYDTTEHKVKVHVSDDGTSGQLEATVTYDGDSQAPVFTNTCKP